MLKDRIGLILPQTQALAVGDLYTWGRGESGSNALGTTASKSTMGAKIGTSKWLMAKSGGVTFVSKGSNFSNYILAIREDGTLWACGSGSNWKLGTGDNNNRLSLVQIGSSLWKYVEAGYYTSHGIQQDGTLWGWGYNSYGQVGDNTQTNKTVPVQIGSSLWSKVVGSASNYATIGLKQDGTIHFWGTNSKGQVGNGTINGNILIPTQIGTSLWLDVGIGTEFCLAIRQDGTLWAWGNNTSGQLGLGDTTNRYIPTKIGSATDWKSVSCGHLTASALKQDGSLYTWGYGAFGQTGNGGSGNVLVPTRLGSAFWSSISMEYISAAGIQVDGSLWVWGANTYYELGTSDTTNRFIPTKMGSATDWKGVSIASGGVAIR